MKKKPLILILSVAAIAAVAIGATLAYFSATDDATNTFTVGNVQIELTEPAWTDEGGGLDNAADVYPGEALAKDPTVENTGVNPCMVRIKVEWPDLGEEDLGFTTGGVAGAIGADWSYSDGFYYYADQLDPGGFTSALFDHIIIPTGLENGVSGENEYTVEISAQAVQAEGIADTLDLSEVKAMFSHAFPTP